MARATKKATTNVLTMPTAASTSRTTSSPTTTDIAERAFALYCERGRQDGYALADWLQAERELHQMAKSTAA